MTGRSGFEPYTPGPYAQAAERWLTKALSQVRDGLDALPAISAAEAALRIEAGEIPADPELLEPPDDH